MTKIYLKRDKEAPLRRRHPWVFSGAIDHITGAVKEGDFVSVYSHGEDLLGSGFFSNGSIAVKIISFGSDTPPEKALPILLKEAVAHRRSLGLMDSAGTDAFRIVNGEGDGLPGLIIDRYASTIVIQCHSLGMHRCRDTIVRAIDSLFEGEITNIYDKSAETLKSTEETIRSEFLLGNSSEVQISENRHKFYVDVAQGQKTGFFLDQRENRARVEDFSQNRSVLNAFSYTGGFSVYALGGGASSVRSVDASKSACALAERNVRANFPEADHEGIPADCFDYLSSIGDKFDLIILDPPAFAKHRGAVREALKGYKSINYLAIKNIRHGGIIFSFSCSQLVSRDDFKQSIMSAAIDAERRCQILGELSHAPCHPVSVFHPEGGYLKGLILKIGK